MHSKMFTCVSKSEFTYPISPARPKKHLGQPFFWLGTHQVQKNKLSVGCSPNKKFTSNKLGPGSSHKWAYDSTYKGYDSLISPFITISSGAHRPPGWCCKMILTWEVLDDSGETLRIEIVAVNQLARALMSLFVVLPKNLWDTVWFKRDVNFPGPVFFFLAFRLWCFLLGCCWMFFLFFCWGGIWGRKGLHGYVVPPRKKCGLVAWESANAPPKNPSKNHQRCFWCKSSWHTLNHRRMES